MRKVLSRLAPFVTHRAAKIFSLCDQHDAHRDAGVVEKAATSFMTASARRQDKPNAPHYDQVTCAMHECAEQSAHPKTNITTVHQHSAHATLAVVATLFGAGHAKMVAQHHKP